jgi:hypothetical protein
MYQSLITIYRTFLQFSTNQAPSSSLAHAAVSLASVDYVAPRPFKGLHITGAGNVTIVGVDGASTTFALDAGGHPYGGLGITRATTTATGIIALF